MGTLLTEIGHLAVEKVPIPLHPDPAVPITHCQRAEL